MAIDINASTLLRDAADPLERLRKENQQLGQELAESMGAMQRRHRAWQEERQEVRRLMDRVEILEATLKDREAGHKQMQAHIERLEAVLKRQETLNVQNNELRKRIQQLESEVSDRLPKAKDADVEGLHQRIQQLETERADVEAEQQQMQSHIRTLEATNTSLTAENAQLRGQIQQLGSAKPRKRRYTLEFLLQYRAVVLPPSALLRKSAVFLGWPAAAATPQGRGLTGTSYSDQQAQQKSGTQSSPASCPDRSQTPTADLGPGSNPSPRAIGNPDDIPGTSPNLISGPGPKSDTNPGTTRTHASVPVTETIHIQIPQSHTLHSRREYETPIGRQQLEMSHAPLDPERHRRCHTASGTSRLPADPQSDCRLANCSSNANPSPGSSLRLRPNPNLGPLEMQSVLSMLPAGRSSNRGGSGNAGPDPTASHSRAKSDGVECPPEPKKREGGLSIFLRTSGKHY